MYEIIYKYKLNPEEPKIMQGDIFKNLPIISNDLLVRVKPQEKRRVKDDKKEIMNEVINSEEFIIAESIIYPSWGILASQDCDIKEDYDLIFYPLIKATSPEYWNYIEEFLVKGVRNTTRRYYLPEMRTTDNSIIGPFYAIFQNPFIIPYNIINEPERYRKMWYARIMEPARKILVGKITNFYSRTPMDEYIFLSNSQIELFLDQNWKNLWSCNLEPKILDGIISKITAIKDALLYNQRQKDISRIFFLDTRLIQEIKKHLLNLFYDNCAHKLIKCCENILNGDKTQSISVFAELLNEVYLKEDSLVTEFQDTNWMEKFNDNVQKLKSGKIIEEISEFDINKEDQEAIKILGSRASSAPKGLLKYQIYAQKYYQICKILQSYFK